MLQEVKVELYYSGAWQDITARDEVYTANPITITRSGTGGSGTSRCDLWIENTDGRYSPRNPSSPLYGLIGRNTQIRVSLGDDVRFVGEVESWPVEWSTTGVVVWVPVTAYGIRRRLVANGSARPARSALRRAIDADTVRPYAYWPLEGAANSDKLYDTARNLPTEQVDQSAAVSGQSGNVRFGSVNLGDGSDLVANIAGSWTLGMPIRPVPAGNGTFAFQFTLNHGNEVRTGQSTVVGLRLDPSVNTNHTYWLVYQNEDGTGRVDVIVADRDLGLVSTTTLTSFTATNLFDGRPRVYQFTGTANGAASVDWTLKINDASVATGTWASGITGVLNAGPWRLGALCTATASAVTALGHCAVYQAASGFTARYQPALGNPGEAAGTRIRRLIAEEGATCTVVDSPDALGGELLGPQGVKTTLELVDDAAAADGGLLSETRDAATLTYRTHDSLVNQDIAVEFDYAEQEVTPPIKPTEDTSRVANIVTVTRDGGAKYMARQDTGTLNTSDPTVDPKGVGGYPSDLTLSLYTDEQAQQQAYWRLHLGTWDSARYEFVPVNVEAIEDTLERVVLPLQVAAVDIGDRVNITNPPVWLPPETIDALVLAYTEVIGTHERTLELETIPALPWCVVARHNGDGTDALGTGSHYSPYGTTLAEDLDTTETGVDITTTYGPLWTTDATDFPLYIVIGGEVMKATACSGAANPQTLTVTRSVNTVTKTHTTGATVELWQAPRYGRGR
jgi:hypothetical protein